MPLPQTHRCPECGRELRSVGEIEHQDQRLSLFVCLDCLVEFRIGYRTADRPLIYTVDRVGEVTYVGPVSPI